MSINARRNLNGPNRSGKSKAPITREGKQSCGPPLIARESPSRSLCPGGRCDSPLPRSLNTKSKDSRVYANARLPLENWRIRVNTRDSGEI
ncbi:unnamed protein product [Lasius platythorax]|uniref:Uncharacterized protein n=1 Tax=Lasius platythorax TaxID=488582 RepID=A0AAV2NQP4_9HYME